MCEYIRERARSCYANSHTKSCFYQSLLQSSTKNTKVPPYKLEIYSSTSYTFFHKASSRVTTHIHSHHNGQICRTVNVYFISSSRKSAKRPNHFQGATNTLFESNFGSFSTTTRFLSKQTMCFLVLYSKEKHLRVFSWKSR